MYVVTPCRRATRCFTQSRAQTHTSMDLDAIRHLEVAAGLVVIYFNQLAHGVWGWTGESEHVRRAVMSKAFTPVRAPRAGS